MLYGLTMAQPYLGALGHVNTSLGLLVGSALISDFLSAFLLGDKTSMAFIVFLS